MLPMSEKRMINVRVTDDEADILSAYADEMGQSQSDVLRAFIRSLEARIRRVHPDRVDPYLLPSLPLSRRDVFPPVAAVYFFISEDGRILYVGETANLSIRCGSHPSYNAAIEIDSHARIHWIERRSGRQTFEVACIKRFRPPLNTRKKSA
jgi:hypothetical protein